MGVTVSLVRSVFSELDSDDDFDFSADDSASDEDSLSVNEPQNNSFHVSNSFEADNILLDAATDATTNMNVYTNRTETITVNALSVIERQLSLYEKVSIMFLLYDDAHFALSQVKLCINQNSLFNFLENWGKREQSLGVKNWQNKFIESLCTIQNYKILKNFGFNKLDLIEQFLPQHWFTSLYINKYRKCLYMVCEKLNKEDCERFIDLIETDFNKMDLKFEHFDLQYLEVFFLYWETINYINSSNLKNLIAIFKQMEFDEICDILQSFESSVNKMDNIEGSDSQLLRVRDISNVLKHSNRYFINSKRPGVCLIINQENFYTEIDKRYQDLLASSVKYKKLENRIGTEKDKQQLMTTFAKFGFTVFTKNNLNHIALIEEIKNVVEAITEEDSLFVCIMSHGEEGVIYGTNSCKVKVKYIQEIMCKCNWKNLNGKPKVLILQSCQGSQCQKIPTYDDSLEIDGPAQCNENPVPITSDLLTFWATVPGYGAIRDKRSGSWFIQSLCEKMNVFGNLLHFEDICTSIIGDVSNKKWRQQEGIEVSMVPVKVSTFRKQFFLPRIC